ncbi:MAG: hypothetical protein HC905_28480 [Bacteroidales bacterium]|nr:hypothetical protein [Bacteroidales bacterium]
MSYSIMAQTWHMLPGNSSGVPLELWFPSTRVVLPQKSEQIDAVYDLSISSKYNVSMSSGVFYRKMKNLTELKEGESVHLNPINWERVVEVGGSGKSYGVEFLLKKQKQKLSGWLSYSISRNLRKFTNIDKGQYFPFRYERIHNLSMFMNYKLTENSDISFVWVFGTGNPITFPNKYYYIYLPGLNNEDIKYIAHAYPSKNSFRMPSYHRLDVAYNIRKTYRKGFATWSFGIYNAYNHHNTYFMYYNFSGDDVKLYSISLFPIIPSLQFSYSF